MAKREQIPPLLACRSAAQIELPRSTVNEKLPLRPRATPWSAFDGIGLKGSIGLVTEPCVTGVGYTVPREERNSISYRDISPCVLFVPIRHDSEMVVNLGLRLAEAGLLRVGVAA